jgi:putative transposase
VGGYIKGTSALTIARTYVGKRKDCTGQNCWARGYFVSTVGGDEEAIKQDIREHEEEDKRQDKRELFKAN